MKMDSKSKLCIRVLGKVYACVEHRLNGSLNARVRHVERKTDQFVSMKDLLSEHGGQSVESRTDTTNAGRTSEMAGDTRCSCMTT